MDVILLQPIMNLGELGDKVSVKPGYGRNYLIPQGKAVPATADNLADFERRRAELEKQASERIAAAEARRDKVADQTVVISANASAEGKLYGSVGTREIALALEAAGYEVEKSEIVLSDGVIRQTGEYEIPLIFGADVDTQIKLVIEGEEG